MILAGPAAAVRAIRGTTSERHPPDAETRAALRAVPRPSLLMRLALATAVFVMVASVATASAPTAVGADDAVADFTASATTGAAPLAVDFVATSTGEPTAWAWDFGDGSAGLTPAPSHSYATAGTFTVRLTITYDDHPPVVVTKADFIVVSAPPTVLTAAIGFADLGFVVGLPVTFVDASTGVPTSWAWDFGDGGTSADAGPTHTYAAAGTFAVSLSVGDGGGHSAATATISVLVPWIGTVQLYQKGIFAAQRTPRWCAPASTQMIRNMITGERDHSSATSGCTTPTAVPTMASGHRARTASIRPAGRPCSRSGPTPAIASSRHRAMRAR